MRRTKRGFQFESFEITKREILASISIIAIFLLIGVLISGKISEHQIEENEKYNKAVKIENTDLFQFGGKYMYVKKVKEKYTMHTRRVSHGSGKHRYYTTQTYWTWDYAGKESKKCKEINFCGTILKSKKIDLPSSDYITTIKESSHIRYKYYGVKTKYTGTIFTVLKDKTISDNSPFYSDMKIEQTVEHLESNITLVIFWIIWIVLVIAIVFGFYYFDNEWLE